MNRVNALAVAGSLSVSVLFANEPARGDGDQDGKEARARSLFEEGRVEMGAGNYSEACPKFADSKTLDPGAGTMLNLAYCYEKLGKAAAAWAEYRAAALAAHEHGRVDWENAARGRAERLESRLVWVVVHAEAQPDGALLAMRLDGDPMSAAALERPLPVDPGHHEVSVAAVGRRPWSTTFEADGEHVWTIAIPVLEPIETPAPRSPPPERPDRRPAAQPGSAPSPLRTAAWVVGGAGAAALAASAILGLVADVTYNGADCAGTACTAAGNDARSRAFIQGHVATAIAVGGGAALAGAAVLWRTAPTRRTTIGVRPGAGEAQLGVSIEGKW
jgi:hypothetical protein